MESSLAQKKCVPCEGGVAPLGDKEIKNLLGQVNAEWEVVDGRKIRRLFTFSDFAGAMKFANTVAEIAEQEDHHPDLRVSWGKVTVSIMTHVIGGLSENDFIVAAKIDSAWDKL